MEGESEDVRVDEVRDDIFTVHYPEAESSKCKVSITKTGLTLEDCECEDDSDSEESEVNTEEFKVEDIYGVHIVRKVAEEEEDEETNDASVYVLVLVYAKASDNLARVRIPRVFEINLARSSYQENLGFARDWVIDMGKLIADIFPNLLSHELQETSQKGPTIKEIIDKQFASLMSPKQTNKREETEQESINDLDFINATFELEKTILFERTFLVIINPVSGQGKGLSLFQDRISPILTDSGVKVKLVITEYPGHAHNLLKTYDLEDINGIVSVGGDGLLNEIVNGVRTRADHGKVSDIPIGVIATGSGNGLARSLSNYSKVSKEYLADPVLYSTLSVARGSITAVNLTEVNLDQRKFFSLLSVGWGLLSDIDIESEVLRYIGEIRFFIWSFIRLIQLRRYKAELSYVPYDSKESITSRVFVNDDFVSVYSACQSHIGSDMLFAPDAESLDSTIHLTYLPSNTGRLACAKFLHELNRDQGQHIHINPVKYVKVKEFTIRCEGGINGYLTVDGEQVKGEEICVKMSDTPLFVFTLE